MTLLRTLLLFALALLALPAAAQELPPRPDGPVYDGANMIDAATKAQLDEKLRAYNKETGRAVIVATVPSLDGETIETYAVELYETWGIGGEETDEGALLLVAQEERKIRIEVGYGSTPTLTDAMSGRIIRNTITPAFKQGDFTGGIVAGVAQMIEALDMDPATARAMSVFPVPGAPTRSTPFGIRPPIFWNFLGSFRNSTISATRSARIGWTRRKVPASAAASEPVKEQVSAPA